MSRMFCEIYRNLFEITNQTCIVSLMKISILCPTRGRPDNLMRILESIERTTYDLSSLEFLVYFDQDDATQFLDLSRFEFVRKFVGPRMWMSNYHNFLYANSTGELIMACADDFVFLSQRWDIAIKTFYQNQVDNYWVVFGNDLGVHAGKMPTHFFLHRDWPMALGTWVQPFRASPWDLWIFDVANDINRLRYLPEVEIQHLHYRQSKVSVLKDSTYQDIWRTQFSFRPMESYKLLYRERRADVVILAEKIGIPTPKKGKYFLGHFVIKFLSNTSPHEQMRLYNSTNIEIFLGVLRRLTPLSRISRFGLRKKMN